MTDKPAKAPKKEKEKRQTPEERLEALRYNHMMYGPTEGELKHAQKKIDYGATYLKHPKFQALVTAFKKGTESKFEVTVAGKTCTIATDGSHITFNDKTIYYSRNLNRHEDNLLLDKASMVQFQTNDALIHLAFAVLKAFPELGAPPLTYLHKKFYWGPEALEEGAAELGSNLLVGSYKHAKVLDKGRK